MLGGRLGSERYFFRLINSFTFLFFSVKSSHLQDFYNLKRLKIFTLYPKRTQNTKITLLAPLYLNTLSEKPSSVYFRSVFVTHGQNFNVNRLRAKKVIRFSCNFSPAASHHGGFGRLLCEEGQEEEVEEGLLQGQHGRLGEEPRRERQARATSGGEGQQRCQPTNEDHPRKPDGIA